jgi:hypothetical protein
VHRWALLPIFGVIGILTANSVTRALPIKSHPLWDGANFTSVQKTEAPQSRKGWIIDGTNLPAAVSINGKVKLRIDGFADTPIVVHNQRQLTFYKDLFDGASRGIPVYVETYGDILILAYVPWVGVPTIKDVGYDQYEVRIGTAPTPALLQTVMHNPPSDAGPGDPVYPFADENLAALRDAQNAKRTVLMVVDSNASNAVVMVCFRSDHIKCVGYDN